MSRLKKSRIRPSAAAISLSIILIVALCGMYLPRALRSLWKGDTIARHPIIPTSKVDTTIRKKAFFELHRLGLSVPQLTAKVNLSTEQQQIKEAMRHAWVGYKQSSWGGDILHPVTKTTSNWVVDGMGVTLIDSLDSLLIMGLDDEYEDGLRWVTTRVSEIRNGRTYSGFISIFETTIRVIGGLLSAFCLTADEDLLTHAEQVARMLLPAFKEGELPKGFINPRTGATKYYESGRVGRVSVADVGSVQLEFRLLSWLTGNSTYDRVATHSLDKLLFLLKDQQSHRMLAPHFITSKGLLLASSSYSVGGNTDSFYEYLLKQYLLSQKSEDFEIYLTTFTTFMKSIRKHLVGNSNGKYYFGLLEGELRSKMDHLSCFMPGLMILMVMEIGDDDQSDPTLGWGGRPGGLMKLAAEVLRTCVGMYDTPSGISPEDVTLDHGTLIPGKREGLLRPETVESLFYMYRHTLDDVYRDQSLAIFNSIVACCRIPEGGFTSLASVLIPSSKRNEMDSFFTAETLKYLFLTFSNSSLIPLSDFVFNTEGHPFPKVKHHGPSFSNL